MSEHGALGRFDGKRHLFPVRVYFEDTDLSGLIYHANYLRYMERARSDMLRAVGIDQRGQHDAGQGVYAVSDLHIRYRAPAKLDDDLIVESRVVKVGAATATIQQRVMRQDQVLTEANVTAAWLTTAGRPQRQPKAWVAAFTALIEEDK
ncbi:Thioesterase domain-containing protein [Sphingomonas antarctica]|uniref:YbgC/FadM family acyl-CoA thioesterase n=1 Tax=Sphingomonas antarctica TaxID=2040274 RepID=UPI0039ED2D56